MKNSSKGAVSERRRGLARAFPVGPQTPAGDSLRAVRGGKQLILSVRQPWAWLIIHAGKDIENRSRPTRVRGRVLIHASQGMTRAEFEDAMNWIVGTEEIELNFHEPELAELLRGGIIGEVEITDCVTKSHSPWLTGPFGYVLARPTVLPFTPIKGQLGFFTR